MARALTRFSLRNFPIRLASGLPIGDDLVTTLKEQSLTSIGTGEHPFTFDVALNNNGHYEILDELGHTILNVPGIPQDQTSVRLISNTIEHLARFQMVRDLGNKVVKDPFQESFRASIFSNAKSFGPNCLIEVQHDSRAELVVENLGDKVLYVSVYDLGPCWQVENIYRGTYAVITPQSDLKRFKGTMSKKLCMKVPDRIKEEGHSSCEDIIKIFITSQPTSFESLELPRLYESINERRTNRTSREDDAGLENWTAVNFPIHISLSTNENQ